MVSQETVVWMEALLTAAEMVVSSFCPRFPSLYFLCVLLSLLLCANINAPFQMPILFEAERQVNKTVSFSYILVN